MRGAHGASGEVAFLPSLGAHRPLDLRAHDAAGGLSLLTTAQRHPDWTQPPPSTVEELFERAATGEEPAAALVEEECARVASVIASLCAVVDPEAVILTGGVGANERLMQRSSELAAGMAFTHRSSSGQNSQTAQAWSAASTSPCRQPIPRSCGSSTSIRQETAGGSADKKKKKRDLRRAPRVGEVGDRHA